MKKLTWASILGLIPVAGCTTMPVADVMDRCWKSQNACCQPQQLAVVAPVAAAVPVAPAGVAVPVQPAPQTAVAGDNTAPLGTNQPYMVMPQPACAAGQAIFRRRILRKKDIF